MTIEQQRALALAAARRRKALGTQQPPQADQVPTDPPPTAPPAAQGERPNLLNSTLATVNGISSAIPGLQGLTDVIGGGISQITGGNFNDYVKHQREVRDALANAAPLARGAGELAGAVGTMGGLAKVAGNEAVGLAGGFGKQVLNSALANQGVYTAGQVAEGKQGTEALGNGIPALAGAAGPIVGNAVKSVGGALAKSATQGAQRKLTTDAIGKGGQTAAQKFSAGSQLFDEAFNVAGGGHPPAISDNAVMRFVGDIQEAVRQYRPTPENDPQATGLLKYLMNLADSANTPGVVVDLKDLHLARQLAGKVAKSPNGRDSAIGTIFIKKLDAFIKDLGPGDILGGGDPKNAANALLKGISTWSRASKVSLIEDAVKDADTYKSGLAEGLKSAFSKLMKSDDYAGFSAAEKQAIRDVAKGSKKQNIASLFGKLGFSIAGTSAHNIVGGSAGMFGLSALLTPILGPAALPAAFATTTAAGMAGRGIAEHLATGAADRAIQATSIGGIPSAIARPNLLAPGRVPIDLLIRGVGQ